MKYKAFTLAEVLVTLAVIGVVAALSIPAIVQNAEEAGAASRVIKYQSILSQAFDQYAVDKNCVGNLACTGVFAGDEQHEHLGNEIKPYFNVIKDCGITTGTGECFEAGGMYKILNGADWSIMDDETSYKLLLADGAIVKINEETGNCENNKSKSGSSPLSAGCGHVNVDINGQKGPNQRGRDVFSWWIVSKGIYPIGSLDDNFYTDTEGNPKCDPTAPIGDGGVGAGCTAKVIKERAINY